MDKNDVCISRKDLDFYESLNEKLNQSEQNHADYIAAVILVLGHEKHMEISRRARSLSRADREMIGRTLETSAGPER